MLKNFKSGYEVSNGNVIASGEKNDCFVRAVANAFEIDYTQAHGFVKAKFNRRNRLGTKKVNSTLKELSSEVFEFQPSGQLNLFEQNDKVFKVKHLGNEPKRGGSLINKKYKHKKVAYTVKAFAQRYNKGTHIVLVHKHALVIKNGVVVDNNINQFNGYRRVVESAFKVTAK